MQFKLLLATLLASAPSGAVAFDDLDCIGIRTCSETRCTHPLEDYTVAFNWSDNLAAVTFDGALSELDLASNPFDPDSEAGMLFFIASAASDDGDQASLIVDFSLDEITATFTQRFGGFTYVAACSDQEPT